MATEPEPPRPATEVVTMDPAVQTAIVEALEGGHSIEEVIEALLADRIVAAEQPPPPPVKPQPLTEDERAALKRLPQVFGSVAPTTRRKLNATEMESLVDERNVISTILSRLEERKSDSIRETLAHHFDVLAEEEALRGLPEGVSKRAQKEAVASIRRDAKGHYAVKQEQQTEHGKAQRIVSGGKVSGPTSADIQRLYDEGKIDRKTWMAITEVPVVAPPKRNLSQARLREAVKRDPSLMFLLAGVTRENLPTTTIKVVR